MMVLPIANCRLPISRDAEGQKIGNWQSAIGNQEPMPEVRNRQLAIGNRQSRVDAGGQQIGDWQLEIGNKIKEYL
jgi:hypothetical protein